jgi:CubicO group peptidase (beta-lactamase class C family)
MDSESSAHGVGGDHAAVDRAVRDVLSGQRPVGLSMAAVRPGRVAWSTRYGHADVASGTRTAPDTAYLWFSMTKIVTATAVMQLVEQGRLALDPP